MDASIARKSMTLGEGATALAFLVLGILSLFVAANAYTPEYAFHAYLFAAASVAAIFVIVNHYYERPAQLPPATVDGKPNYNMGPVKFATVAAVFWGIAGFTIGLWAALELAFPVLNFDLPWFSFGRIRPLHTSAVIFAFGAGSCTHGTSVAAGFERLLERFAGWQLLCMEGDIELRYTSEGQVADTILGNSGVNCHAGAKHAAVWRQYLVHRGSLDTRNTGRYRLRNRGARVSPETGIGS